MSIGGTDSHLNPSTKSRDLMSSRSFGFEGMWDRRLAQGCLTKGQGSVQNPAGMSPCWHNTEFRVGSSQILSGIRWKSPSRMVELLGGLEEPGLVQGVTAHSRGIGNG